MKKKPRKKVKYRGRGCNIRADVPEKEVPWTRTVVPGSLLKFSLECGGRVFIVNNPRDFYSNKTYYALNEHDFRKVFVVLGVCSMISDYLDEIKNYVYISSPGLSGWHRLHNFFDLITETECNEFK